MVTCSELENILRNLYLYTNSGVQISRIDNMTDKCENCNKQQLYIHIHCFLPRTYRAVYFFLSHCLPLSITES